MLTLAKPGLFSSQYWKEAAKQFANTKMVALAAVLVALRVLTQAFLYIPLGENLGIYLDFLFSAVGSAVYGPLVGFASGFFSDILSSLLFPKGTFFPLFALTEMTGSFLFGLFLWKREITATKLILSKFVYTVVCNLVMMPFIMILYYNFLGDSKGYAFVTLPRLVKNIALLPIEAFLLVLFFSAVLPGLKQLHLFAGSAEKLKPTKIHFILLGAMLIVSVGILWFYLKYLLPLL